MTDRADPRSGRHRRGAAWAFAGITLLAAVLYVLSGPGRIDIIDGQFRYEVAHSLLTRGEPTLQDPVLRRLGLPGEGGEVYGRYGAGGSVAALPLLWIAHQLTDPYGELHRFAFTLTTPLLAAAACGLMWLLLLQLEVPPRRALGSVAITACCSMLWPSAVSTFTNAQIPVFFLGALLLGHRSAVRGSVAWAAAGGAVLGLVVTYDEYLLALVPGATLSTVSAAAWRRGGDGLRARATAIARTAWRDGSVARGAAFIAAIAFGVALYLAFNEVRFGSPFHSGKADKLPAGHPMLGNPVAGLAGLLVSPGKGLLWFSPPVVLGLLGMRELLRRHPSMGAAVAVTSATLVLVIAPFAFHGGDWCWGPRYLTLLAPALGLALPWAWTRRPRLTAAVAAWGLAVQLLAVSVDTQRYFFEHALPDFFWGDGPWVYFERSQLVARPGELLDVIVRGVPDGAELFNHAPDPDSTTYCTFGNGPAARPHAPIWMRGFQVFHLPRPWPLWMSSSVLVRSPPVDVPVALLLAASSAALGAIFLRRGLRDLAPSASGAGAPPPPEGTGHHASDGKGAP